MSDLSPNDVEQQRAGPWLSWRRIWPVLLGIFLALSVAAVAFLAGNRLVPAVPIAASASQANASNAGASMAAASAAAGDNSPFTNDTGLKLLFGNSQTDKDGAFASWTPSALPNTDPFNRFRNLPLRAVAVATFPVHEDSEARQLLITAASTHLTTPGHDDAVILGIAVFHQTTGGWQLLRQTPAVSVAGNFAQAPQGKPAMLGANLWGLVFDGNDINQGVQNRYELIIDQRGDQFVDSGLRLDLGQNNVGACDDNNLAMARCYSYSGELRFVAVPGADHYDIQQTLHGSRPASGGSTPGGDLISFHETRWYHYQNGNYLEDSSRHDVSLQPVPPRQTVSAAASPANGSIVIQPVVPASSAH